MKKLLSLFLITLYSMIMLAKEGGTLTPSTSPIDPSETVTLTYDGTGTNFANWTPQCFIHSWLVPYEGKSFTTDYGTTWESCNGDADYEALPAKVKMTLISKGKYSISMNIKEFFGVAEEDLEKISDIGIVVRAQYPGDENQTKDFVLPVEVPGSTPHERPSFYITGDENLVGKAKAWNPKAIPVYGETYSIPNVEPGYYEMKITIDGTFETAKGYKDLTGSRRWLVYDVEDGNIGLQVGATCDIKVTYNDISFLVEGKLGPQKATTGQWYVDGNFTGNEETDWFAGKTALTYQAGIGYVGSVHLEANQKYQFKMIRVGKWPESEFPNEVFTSWYSMTKEYTMTFDNNLYWLMSCMSEELHPTNLNLQTTFEGDYTFIVKPTTTDIADVYIDVIYPEDPRQKRTITFYPGESKERYPQYIVYALGSEDKIGYYTNMTPVEVEGELAYYTYELPIELTKYLRIIRTAHDVPGWQYLAWGDEGNIWNDANLQDIPLNCNTSWYVSGALNGRFNPMRVFFCGPTSDGYYLSLDGFNWPLYNVDDAHKFVLKDADKHIYSLITNLSVGDKLRALEIKDLQIKNHYPLPDMDSYTVDAAHAGEKTVLFCPNYQSDWSEFGGYIYIESESVTSIENHQLSGTITKLLRSDRLLILRGEKTYTLQGQEVK